MLKMLARSCLRSTRAVGAVRNGAINTSKVRLANHFKCEGLDSIVLINIRHGMESLDMKGLLECN